MNGKISNQLQQLLLEQSIFFDACVSLFWYVLKQLIGYFHNMLTRFAYISKLQNSTKDLNVDLYHCGLAFRSWGVNNCSNICNRNAQLMHVLVSLFAIFKMYQVACLRKCREKWYKVQCLQPGTALGACESSRWAATLIGCSGSGFEQLGPPEYWLLVKVQPCRVCRRRPKNL